MAKFFGRIGYGVSQETEPNSGVWEDVIVERLYKGDLTYNSRQLADGSYLNDDISISNSISIVSDAYANEHFFAIRYIEWAGTLWQVSEVEVKSPRLILRLGGVYNGPTATGTSRSSGRSSRFA